MLGRPLAPRERVALVRTLRGLLRWQHRLGTFPRIRGTPNATPYVSLYAHGGLRGCFGSQEGRPDERIARSFLLALADWRFGGVAEAERAGLAADVTFLRRAQPVRADEAASAFEPGVQGVAYLDGARATVLLPSVAREKGHDASAVLDVLASKAAAPRATEGLVWVLDVEEVSSLAAADHDGKRAARRFLESLVASNGATAFEVDPATGVARPSGPMRLGRIAVAVEALTALRSPKASKARTWLAKELRRGTGEKRADMSLGTLALAARARVEVPLVTCAKDIDPASCSPWHAAQAASVLGKSTPAALWDVCTRSLEAQPLAPYTLMAARLRQDARVVERCARELALAIRTQAPFRGGAAFGEIPETALTAVTVEALDGLPGARKAVGLARDFILRRQILDVPAAMCARVLGAFRGSAIAPALRCDITGHAALALSSFSAWR